LQLPKRWFHAVFILTFPALLLAQSPQPTNNVITRILMIASSVERGTAFSLDVDNREYWITAKHILTGATHPPYGSYKKKSETLFLMNPGGEGEQWIPVEFSVIDPGEDIDVVVLAPKELILKNPLPSANIDTSGVSFGGDCEFLGFPNARGWRTTIAGSSGSYWLPFVKHCTVSAFTEDGKRVYILDGIANKGFSGGPVIYKTGLDQRIIAVVSGYQTEPADAAFSLPIDSKNGQPPPVGPQKPITGTVDVNSGFIVAYSINYAKDAIKKNPIGPLRPPK
jgi:hypothetical protein